jgi:hypothetical protein
MVFFFFLVVVVGIELRALALARQALLPLEHIPSPSLMFLTTQTLESYEM